MCPSSPKKVKEPVNKMKKLLYGSLLSGIFLSIGIIVYADESKASNFDCVFDRHYAAYLNEDKTERYKKGTTSLSIIKNKTTRSTANLDGAVRATNSANWVLVSSDDLGARYIGSDGDLLTVLYKPGDGTGKYKASLQWTSLGYAFSSIGICSGKP